MTDIGVGVVGIGDISSIYLRNLPLFAGLRLVACAGRDRDATAERARQFEIEALSPEALLKREDIGIVVNLTPPVVHEAVTLDALSAGKHVFSEKPLATSASAGRTLVSQAAARSLRLGCAPDTFLGAGGRLARQIVERGEIGTVLSGTCVFLSRGMEHRHPSPEFFFKQGGGPVLDIGPYYLTTLVNLMGPVLSVQAEASVGFRERLVSAPGRQFGRRISVETPTTVMALLRFRDGGVVTVLLSWDVLQHDHRPIELYGSEGSLLVPDPDTYGGTVYIGSGQEWSARESDEMTFGIPNWRMNGDVAPDLANYRGLGVAEMASAIRHGTPHRSSGALASHVLDVMEAILVAAESRNGVQIASEIERVSPMSEAEAHDLWRPSPAL